MKIEAMKLKAAYNTINCTKARLPQKPQNQSHYISQSHVALTIEHPNNSK